MVLVLKEMRLKHLNGIKNQLNKNIVWHSYANGIGVENDEVKAFEWYKKSAEQGFSNAQCNLGVCYANGIGVKKDEVKAFEWYKKSAEQGFSNAQYNLGYCYQNGKGVEKDEVQAFD